MCAGEGGGYTSRTTLRLEPAPVGIHGFVSLKEEDAEHTVGRGHTIG